MNGTLYSGNLILNFSEPISDKEAFPIEHQQSTPVHPLENPESLTQSIQHKKTDKKTKIRLSPEDLIPLSTKEDLNDLLENLGDGRTSRYYKDISLSGHFHSDKPVPKQENESEDHNKIEKSLDRLQKKLFELETKLQHYERLSEKIDLLENNLSHLITLQDNQTSDSNNA